MLATTRQGAPRGLRGIQCARLGKLGHLEMLNDTRVYRQIREWLGVLGAPAEC